MITLLLYLAITITGYYIGSHLQRSGIQLSWAGSVQTAAIILLVFVMGSRIGSNDEVISSLGSIGLQALLITAAVMAGSVAMISIFRRLLGFDRFGVRRGKGQPSPADEAGSVRGGVNRLTLIIVVFVAAGFLAGRFILPGAFIDITGTLLTIFLCVLLLFIGIDIGAEGTLLHNFKSAGWRVLVFPAVSIAGALAGAVLAGAVLSLHTKDALCIASGLGWYSLAPAMLAEYSAAISALCFLHNVMREVIGMLLIPVTARRIGYIEATGLVGSPAMDVCLPVIERATSADVAICSFVNGAVQSAAVPVLVSIFLAL